MSMSGNLILKFLARVFRRGLIPSEWKQRRPLHDQKKTKSYSAHEMMKLDDLEVVDRLFFPPAKAL